MLAAIAIAGSLALALASMPAAAQEKPAASAPPQGIQAFVAAYPDHLVRIENGNLVWRDGTKMPLAHLGLDREGRPRIRYQPASDPAQAATEAISAVDYEPIFLKMYGDCRVRDIGPRLAPVRWNKAAPDGGDEVKAASANGVADALQRVSDEIDTLTGDAVAVHRTMGGTYNCRTIAQSNRLSLHGFGIAIDINPTRDGYWLTAPVSAKGEPIRRNRVPMEIVEAFERQGFVWGGRWNQFDTFHFEYRPEYFLATGGRLPERLTRRNFTAFFGGRARSAVVERMSYAPRAPGAMVCHRWVRQPGKNFGRCLSATIKPAKPTSPRRKTAR